MVASQLPVMGPDWPQEAHFPAHSAPRQDLDSFAASKALLSSESFLTHSLSSLIPVDCRTSPLARALLQLGLPLILSYFLLFHFGVTILESLLRLAEKGPSWPAAIIVYSVLSPRYRERCPKWWLFFSFLFCSACQKLDELCCGLALETCVRFIIYSRSGLKSTLLSRAILLAEPKLLLLFILVLSFSLLCGDKRVPSGGGAKSELEIQNPPTRFLAQVQRNLVSLSLLPSELLASPFSNSLSPSFGQLSFSSSFTWSIMNLL